MTKKRKPSFYGVRVGLQPGVYDNWEECKLQVDGFPGCRFKGFSTRDEAENYVNDCLTGHQNNSVPTIEIIQSQENTNVYKRCKESALPVTTPKKHTIQPCLQKIRTPEEITSPLHVSTLKEEVTSLEKLSTKEPSNYFKLVEENGQRFVVFESIKKFDSYFEGLCHKRQLGKSWNSEASCGNHEIKSQEQTSNNSQDIQTQVTAEDNEFVYFKDEDELKSFLEPYFKMAEHKPPGPAQVYQSFVAVGQVSFAQQDSSEFSQSRSNLDAVEAISFIVHQGIYQIEFDGASKGNPGLAGAGALIRCPHGSVVFEMTEFLGSETNNVAEYRALILGLKVALSKGMRRITAQGDSKLVCLQVTGAWKVENEGLKNLHQEVKRLEELFEVFSIVHVRREYNSAADALANKAVYLREPAHEVAKPISECCL